MSQPLIMSASGVRGIVGDSLTPQIALNIALAFGTLYPKKTIIVGGDTRTSHTVYKSAVISGLTACGCHVIDIGHVPTPTCQQLIRHHQASGAIVITASHNPIQWNGLKLMNAEGAFFNQDEYNDFNHIYQRQDWAYATHSDVGSLIHDKEAIQTHINRIFSVLDPSPIRNAQLKVLIDPNQGAACEADKMLLEACGVTYTILNGDGNGQFAHNPEPSEKISKKQLMS